ncbi:MAG: NAD-dependent epimerase/dehydratase family protein [Acidobacteria bacterium]|nr:NAD-dependent epimerase/dehydratase family protein [Acidobacteriota bacterium]
MSHLHPDANTVTFRGTRATLTLDRNDFAKCVVSGLMPGMGIELTPEQPFVDPAWPRDFVSCFAQQFHDFAAAVRGQPVRVSAADARATTALIEHAYRVRIERRAGLEPERPGLPVGRTVVTGGTGFIGGTLAERLAELGFTDLVLPVRNYRTCADAARFPVTLPRVDLAQRDQVRAAVQGARWVFHLAYGQTDAEARRITVDATRLLIEEAVAARVEAVVVLSTMGVFGHPDTQSLVDESWPYAPAYGNYGRTKAEMERWCLNPATPLGTTRVVVLNPSCVYGPRGKTYTRLPADLAKEGKFAWVAGGRGIANYTYVENLVDAMLLAATTPQAHQQRYLVNDGSCSWRELLTPLLGEWAVNVPDLTPEALRSHRPSPVEPSTLRQVARHLVSDVKFLALVNRHPVLGPLKQQLLNRFRGRMERLRTGPPPLPATPASAAPPVPPDWLTELFGPTRTRFSSAKLQQLGWRPRVSLAEGQRRSAEWLKVAGVMS